MGEVSRGEVTDGNATRESEEAHVLHVDDDEAFLEMSQRFLSDDHDLSVATMTDPEAALGRLEEFECVISDYDMPPMDGIEFLEKVRERDADLPFVLFTGKGSEEVAAEAISAGVTDYLQKGPSTDRFTVLANRVLNAVERQRAERRAEEKDREIRQIHERITDAFVALDDEWEYTHVNRQAAELLERDAESLLGTTLWESFPETLDSPFETELRRAFDEQVSITFEAFYAPLDSWLEIRAFPSESGLSIYFRDISERKERERRYNAIFNNTYQFTGLMEPDGTLIEANETALNFVGADRETVVDRPLWETPWFQFDDETRQIGRESVEQARNGELYRNQFPIEGTDGETIRIDYSVRPVRDETGTVTLLVPEGRDITELKQRESQLKEERAFTDSIFDAMPDILYAYDEDGDFLRWNDQFSTATGYDDEEIAAMDPLDFHPPEEHEWLETVIESVIADGETLTFESRLLDRDGDRIPYEFAVTPLTVETGSTAGLLGIGREITERKTRERRFEAVFNNTYQFTGLMEPDGTLIEANETALAFGGLDREDVVGKPVWKTHWFQESNETRRAAKRAVERASEGEFVREEVAVRGDERTAVIDFSVKPVYDETGEVTLLIPEGRDITELKRRERQLEQQNEQLETFASIISHDLKSPLTVANGNIELAMETGDDERLEEARSALERMNSLIDELLELAKHGDIVEEPEPILLHPLFADVTTDVIGASSATVDIEFDDGATIVAEESRLYSLLSNLLDNAIEHGGEDPAIEVGIDGGTLYVADDGSRIPESERESVFDPGYSGTDSTGFGLTIVEAIADAHGWEVGISESRWGGTRFEISGLDVQYDG